MAPSSSGKLNGEIKDTASKKRSFYRALLVGGTRFRLFSCAAIKIQDSSKEQLVLISSISAKKSKIRDSGNDGNVLLSDIRIKYYTVKSSVVGLLLDQETHTILADCLLRPVLIYFHAGQDPSARADAMMRLKMSPKYATQKKLYEVSYIVVDGVAHETLLENSARSDEDPQKLNAQIFYHLASASEKSLRPRVDSRQGVASAGAAACASAPNAGFSVAGGSGTAAKPASAKQSDSAVKATTLAKLVRRVDVAIQQGLWKEVETAIKSLASDKSIMATEEVSVALGPDNMPLLAAQAGPGLPSPWEVVSKCVWEHPSDERAKQPEYSVQKNVSIAAEKILRKWSRMQHGKVDEVQLWVESIGLSDEAAYKLFKSGIDGEALTSPVLNLEIAQRHLKLSHTEATTLLRRREEFESFTLSLRNRGKLSERLEVSASPVLERLGFDLLQSLRDDKLCRIGGEDGGPVAADAVAVGPSSGIVDNGALVPVAWSSFDDAVEKYSEACGKEAMLNPSAARRVLLQAWFAHGVPDGVLDHPDKRPSEGETLAQPPRKKARVVQVGAPKLPSASSSLLRGLMSSDHGSTGGGVRAAFSKSGAHQPD